MSVNADDIRAFWRAVTDLNRYNNDNTHNNYNTHNSYNNPDTSQAQEPDIPMKYDTIISADPDISRDPFVFEPGNKDYSDLSGAFRVPITNAITLRFEADLSHLKEPLYQLEYLKPGSPVYISCKNPYSNTSDSLPGSPPDSPRFDLIGITHSVIGSIPENLANALFPLYGNGYLQILSASIHSVVPLNQRSRYATHPVLFIALRVLLDNSLCNTHDSPYDSLNLLL